MSRVTYKIYYPSLNIHAPIFCYLFIKENASVVKPLYIVDRIGMLTVFYLFEFQVIVTRIVDFFI